MYIMSTTHHDPYTVLNVSDRQKKGQTPFVSGCKAGPWGILETHIVTQ